MVLDILSMPGPRAQNQAEYSDHPLRAALVRGDRLLDRSGPALEHLLGIGNRSLLSDAVVAQVGAMLADLAERLASAIGDGTQGDLAKSICDRLTRHEQLRRHCQSLALEWRLALLLEDQLALDPVLSPSFSVLVGGGDALISPLAMATLAAQTRFAQTSRRMELPLEELPAELFHEALEIARHELGPGDPTAKRGEARLRAAYDEGASRLALMARLVSGVDVREYRLFAVEEAGVALWLSALSASSGENRDVTACAAGDPSLGRLLLTMRAAGVASAEAERQVLSIHPDADLPRGLQDIGTREAAIWLVEARS